MFLIYIDDIVWLRPEFNELYYMADNDRPKLPILLDIINNIILTKLAEIENNELMFALQHHKTRL